MKLTPKQLEDLKAPLAEEAINPHPTKPYLSTIKAIYVVERLNEVFGIGGWQITNEFIERVEKMVVIKAKFLASEIQIESFGGNDNSDLGDAYKGACTDALTKIGSYLYIGMDVFKGLSASGSSRTASGHDLVTKTNYGKSNYNPVAKKGKPASDKQKKYVASLAEEKGVEIKESDIDNMDGFQASQKIEELLAMKSRTDDDTQYGAEE